MKKKSLFIVIVVFILMVLIGSVVLYIDSIRKDHALVIKNMSKIGGLYDKYNESINKFEDYRESLYEKYLGDVYFENIDKKHKKIEEELAKYEKIVENLENEASELGKYCLNVYYPDSQINLKCKGYRDSYEQINNSYVRDVSEYNKNIDQYNKLVTSDKKIKKIITTRNYIDYNKDGEMEGK